MRREGKEHCRRGESEEEGEEGEESKTGAEVQASAPQKLDSFGEDAIFLSMCSTTCLHSACVRVPRLSSAPTSAPSYAQGLRLRNFFWRKVAIRETL